MNNTVLALRPQSAAAPILSNRSFVQRFCGRAALLLLLLGLASPVWAMCVLEDSGKIGGTAFPGEISNFIFSVNEDGMGAECVSAQYRLEESLDTSGDPPGSFIRSALQGTGFPGNGVFGSFEASDRGGGEFRFRVYCTSGCADTVNPQFEAVYTIEDRRETLAISGDGQVAGTNQAFTSPVQLLTKLNGVGDASAVIDWQISPPGAATFVASGTDTYTEAVDGSGISAVDIMAGPSETSMSVIGCVQGFGCKEAAFFSLSISNSAVISNISPSVEYFVNQNYPLSFLVLNNGSPVAEGTVISFEDDPGCMGLGTGTPVAVGDTFAGQIAFNFNPDSSGTVCRLVRWDINGDTGPGPINQSDDITLPLFLGVSDFYELTAVDPPGGNVVLRPGQPQDLRVNVTANGVPDEAHVFFFNQTAGPAQMNGATLGPVAPSGGTTSTSVNASVIGEYQVRARYTFNPFLDGQPTLLAPSSGDLPVDVLFNITVRNLVNAVDDDFSSTPLDGQAGGATPSVHGNDQFNLSTLGASQVVTSILGDGGLTGVNITSGGVINVPAPRAAGSYPVVYQLCDVLEPTNCASATATIVITAPAIVASDDNFVGAPTFSASAGGSTSSVYANDTIGGAPFTAADVTASVLNDGGLVGITINPSSGALDLPAPPLPVGVFAVTYEICDVLNPTSCDSAQAQLDIANTVPTFSSTPLTSATEDLAYSYAIATTEPDSGDSVSISSDSTLPGWLSLVDNGDGTATLSGTPLNADVGVTPSIDLRVTDSIGGFSTQSFTITVGNSNDTPQFTSTAPTAATEGVLYSYAITATDEDAGDILSISSISTLPGWLALVDNGNGSATLSGTPTNADVGSFSIDLQVSDLALASDTQAFTIVVTNVNEAPVFGQPSYSFAVDENAAGGTPVGSAGATDPDVGQTLSYAITADSSGGAFAIDGNGQISVVDGSALDFETTTGFTLTVQATDDDLSPLSSSVSVLIDLNDLNELPTIVAQARSVDENSPDGTPVGAPLLADDVDAGANGVLGWSIIGGNTGGAFAVDGNGQLSVASQSAINLANTPFSLQVQVQDGGGLTASATVTVTVGDVNDAPVFGQSSYSFAVNENAANGSPVGAAVAVDVDAGQTLSYTITADSSGGLFAIDSAGQISVANGSGLDFETAPSFSLTVQATDNDASPLSASAAVQISLNDLNEAPSITGQARNVDENSSAGTLLGSPLLANDVDAGANGVLSWSIVGGNTGGAFVIDTDGQLSVANPGAVALGNAPFSLQVQVLDGGGLSASATVTISVNDIAMSLVAVSGQGQSALPGAALPEPLVVRAEDESNPVGQVTIDFSVSPAGAATVTPSTGLTGPDGSLAVNVQISALAPPGSSIQITAARGDDPNARAVFSVGVTAPVTLSTLRLPADSGDGQSGLVGTALQPLRVLAEDNGAAVAGVDILWSVSGPASLSAAQSSTDVGGVASIGVTLGSSPGPVTVTAQRADAPLALVAFTLAALPNPDPALLLVSGNGQSGLLGTRADAPIVVRLLAGDGSPSAGETIQWEVLSANAVLDASSSTTDAQGEAQVGFVFGDAPGAVQIRAAHAGSGLSVLTLHQATTATVGVVEGGNQIGVAGQPLPERFVINLAPALRKALGGARVDWQVLSGGGSLESDFTLTDDEGRTSNLLTLGVLGGENVVRAIVPGGQEVLFTAQGGAAPGSLVAVSGDGQTLPTTTASAPLVVQLRDAAGQPVAGAAIDWSAENATVEPASSVTDAQGRAQTVASVLLPGSASVSASTEVIDAAAVTFTLNGGVANISSLSPEQEQTSDAIDQLCPALAALPSRSPGQEDLFQRCLELVDNAGTNPADVQDALDQLPTDIGITLSEVGTTAVVAQNNNFEQRFRQVRTEQAGGSRNRLDIGFWTPDGALPLSFLPAAVGDDTESAEGADLGSDFSRLGFFATGQIGRGKVDQGQQSPEFEFDIGGLTAGVDYRFNDQWVGGLALGYSDNSAELSDDRGELDSRALSLTAYATWYNEQSWYVDGTLLAGRSNNDLLRRIRYSIRALDGSLTQIDQRATASTDGSQIGATFALGKDWQKGPWSLSGYVRGAYTRVETDAYTERMLANLPGQGLALVVDARSTRSTTSVLGGRATYILSRDWGILMPTASLEWEHEYQDDPGRLTARFLFDPEGAALTQEGDDIDTDYFNVGIGLSALFPGGRSGFLTYEQLVGSDRLRQGILSLGVRIEF